MLRLNNVSKKYKDIVLNNISVDFKEGNLYILRGVNGSGKSTIIKILSGIIYKTSGNIENDVSISYLPDKFMMPKLLKVKAYLDILKIPFDFTSKFQIPNKRIGELSKGNLAKLGILQIMYNECDCYILDEPLDGLDDFAKKLLKSLILEKLNDNKIVILSLHTKTLFNELNPIIYEIKEGELYEKKKRNIITN